MSTKLPVLLGIITAGFLGVGLATLAGLGPEVWLTGVIVLAVSALAVFAQRDD